MRAQRYLTAVACVLMGCAIGGVVTWSTLTGAKNRDPALIAGVQQGSEKYQEIMELVDQYYIGDDVDMTQVNDAMAAGVVSGIGDRWSYYVSAEDYQNYVQNIQNAYVGIGVTIAAKLEEDGTQNGYEITDTTSGGSAQEAGVLAGDVLIQVDGADVTEASLTEVKTMVQGQEGTTVTLTFLREGKPYTLEVERRAMTVIPASGKMLDDTVGYIAIDNFDAGCSDTVIGLVEDLQSQGAKAMVFDVRNNPGGLKTELTALLDYLLPEGTIFHTVNYAGKEEIISSDAACVDIPMAVLVNGSSYSAAEYFACALQEYGVGTVVGEQTFGKGYYQIGLNLSDGSAVNLSIGKYFTPSGKSLIDVGVTPDIQLELDDEQATALARNQLEPKDDPQLQAAVTRIHP